MQPLHFILSDRFESVVIESTANGINVHENTLGVLTNEPAYDFHLANLTHYMQLSPKQPTNTFYETVA